MRSSKRRPTSAGAAAQRQPAARAGTGRAKKVSITVDERVLADIAAEAKHSGRTLSAEITEALAREVRRRNLQRLIEEYETEHGVISAQEIAKIRREWLG